MLVADGVTFDWNSVNLGGISVGGGLLAIAVFIGPKIPQILDWIDRQIDKKRAFQREQRKEATEENLRLMKILSDMAVVTEKFTDELGDVKDDLKWLIEYVRQGGKIHLPMLPPPPSETKNG